MPNIYFTPEFIADMLRSTDKGFHQRVWRNIFTENADFRIGENDHRFHGIQDAWIRYVSRGNTAYRIIYVRKGADVYLYRAGPHSVEDNLNAPATLDIGAANQDLKVEYGQDRGQSFHTMDVGDLLVSKTRLGTFTLIPDYLHRMFHVSHEEIFLISPYIDHQLVSSHGVLGNFLDRQIEEDAVVSILTRQPSNHEEQASFENLAARGIGVYFCKKLHAKLYLFEIDKNSLNEFNKMQTCKVAILGSSNLTEMGLGFEKDGKCNEELCYRSEDYRYDEFRDYAQHLTIESQDFTGYKNSLRRF